MTENLSVLWRTKSQIALFVSELLSLEISRNVLIAKATTSGCEVYISLVLSVANITVQQEYKASNHSGSSVI
jgi:hypothetical protein